MKTRKSIYTLLIVAMCSCSGSTTPVKEQLEAVQTVQQTVEQLPEKEYKKLTEEPGVVFYDITLEEALEKAKKEGKYVLIDCHTKSCGPCRKMENGVFPQEHLGKFMNERFVPIMRDMEEGEGLEIAEKYNVQIYPTMLILLPNATKEGEIVGAEFNIDFLIEKLKEIIHEK